MVIRETVICFNPEQIRHTCCTTPLPQDLAFVQNIYTWANQGTEYHYLECLFGDHLAKFSVLNLWRILPRQLFTGLVTSAKSFKRVLKYAMHQRGGLLLTTSVLHRRLSVSSLDKTSFGYPKRCIPVCVQINNHVTVPPCDHNEERHGHDPRCIWTCLHINKRLNTNMLREKQQTYLSIFLHMERFINAK